MASRGHANNYCRWLSLLTSAVLRGRWQAPATPITASSIAMRRNSGTRSRETQ